MKVAGSARGAEPSTSRKARAGKSRKRPQVPCVFGKGATRGAIDDRVKGFWTASFGAGPVPFGDLRLSFKRFHCRAINPYGGECPFAPQECARAFLGAVKEVCDQNDVHGVRNPQGYFVRVAKTTGARRADEAVHRRAAAASIRRTGVYLESDEAQPHPATTSPQPHDDPSRLGDPHPAGEGARSAGGAALAGREREADASSDRPDASLPRRRDGPVSVGDLFGRLAPRPREGRADDGEEGGR